MDDLKLEYFKSHEADSYAFYRIPKLLFTNEYFKKISIEAKLLYSMMLNRMELSIKNNWLDKDGNVFIYYTLEEAMENLGYAHTKIIRIMNELDDKKGVGLIVRKKQGQGKPTKIYVKKFIVSAVKTSKNENSETPDAPENADNNASNYDCESENDAELTAEEVQTSEKQKSRTNEKGSVDCSDCYASNKEKSYTEFSDNQSIYPSISPFVENSSIYDGLMGRVSDEDLRFIVLDELIDQQTLPYTYIQDQRKMEFAIKILCDYDRYAEYSKKVGMNDFRFASIKLFTEALTEMLTTKENMTLRGSCVTYAKVYDKLIPFINFENYEPFFLDLPETVIEDFEVACKERSIKNHLAYMKSCIWNVLQVGDIGIQALIKKDFG